GGRHGARLRRDPAVGRALPAVSSGRDLASAAEWSLGTDEGTAGDGPYEEGTDTGRETALFGAGSRVCGKGQPEWACSAGSDRSALSIARFSSPESRLTWILRGFAFSATGTTRRSTPSV